MSVPLCMNNRPNISEATQFDFSANRDSASGTWERGN